MIMNSKWDNYRTLIIAITIMNKLYRCLYNKNRLSRIERYHNSNKWNNSNNYNKNKKTQLYNNNKKNQLYNMSNPINITNHRR